MAKKPSWRLVIDTSVTSAASPGKGSLDPTPRRCRELLQAVLEICHRIVITPKIAEEWKAHRSRFSSRWRTSMYARKKVCVLEVEPENPDLERAVLRTAESDEERAALKKDLPFVLSALATDHTILSRDDAARQLYRRATRQIAQLRSITWANPATDREVMTWLRGEVETPSALRLGEDEPGSE